MGSRQNIIELNGKRYDARTGQQLPAHQTATSANGTTYLRPATSTGVAIDGMSKRSATPRPATPPAHAVHQRAEHSKTLMRTAVKKPEVTKTKATPTIQKPKGHTRAALDSLLDSHRLSRAQKVPRSHNISRFGETGPQKLTTITSVLPVRPAPAAPQPPALDQHHHTKLDTHTSRDPFQHAIDKATTHKQTPAKVPSRHHRAARRLHVSPKILSISTTALIVVLLGGFFAYQNVPNLSMRVATARSGMQGSLPDYKPAGFSMSGPIQYKKGQITVSFKSRTDNRQFNINQRVSNWNGQSLLDEFVAVGKRPYQTYQNDGKTIYIYDQNNATWVDRGIWYQIEGNSALSSDQLLRLASSM